MDQDFYDEPGYAYAWQDEEDLEEDLEEDQPSLSAAERNPSLR